MGNDPNQPGYRPQYDPGNDLDVGHGWQFGADLHMLYRAGRRHLPEAARASSAVTSALHDERQRMEWTAASVQDQPALRKALALHEELHFATRHTTISLRETGEALVGIADLYVRTDEAATEAFRDEYGHYGGYGESTPEVPPPPSDTAPHDHKYQPPTYNPPGLSFWPFGG